MPNYNDAQGVADLLSQFDFNIISEGPGDFSTQHRKYTCEFSKPGIESFTTRDAGPHRKALRGKGQSRAAKGLRHHGHLQPVVRLRRRARHPA